MNTKIIDFTRQDTGEVDYNELATISEYEVCARWGRSPRSLLNWRNQGKMPEFYRNARRVYYYRADIEALEKKRPDFMA